MEYVEAEAAAKFLGVTLPTLYTYAGRGLIRRIVGRTPRERRYSLSDLQRLKDRREARLGHAPAAAAALKFGPPVLESAITSVANGRLRYRGVDAEELAVGSRFEDVVEHLWAATGPKNVLPIDEIAIVESCPKVAEPLDAILAAVVTAGLADTGRFSAVPWSEWGRGRTLLSLAAVAAAAPAGSRRVRAAAAREGVAARLAVALGARQAAAVEAVERALILCADHELNASAFAARVASSAGADLYMCVSAGLCALSGYKHGRASDRIEALFVEARAANKPGDVIADRLRRGEPVPGFGHALYPDGDPRTVPLLDAARQVSPDYDDLPVVRALVDSAARQGLGAPTVDFGLVVVANALGLARGGATALFAVGRMAGLVAHALEQRSSPDLLRPRARYVGV